LAHRAFSNRGAHVDKSISESLHGFCWLSEEVKGESTGRFAANRGQCGE
jgi:hypothetical protein